MTLCYYCCFNAVENNNKKCHYGIVGNTGGSWESKWPKVGGQKPETHLFHIISMQSRWRVFWAWELGGGFRGSMRKKNVSYHCHIPLYNSSVMAWELDANSNRKNRYYVYQDSYPHEE